MRCQSSTRSRVFQYSPAWIATRLCQPPALSLLSLNNQTLILLQCQYWQSVQHPDSDPHQVCHG
ncbi:hypothetical protein LJ740_17135 [Planctobacterium marinum]|nr:hypothetical protein [Planctobacterium marinum]